MNHPVFAATTRLMVFALTGLLFSGGFSACAADNKKPKIYHPGKTQTVGIINPDGGKTILIVPEDLSDKMAGYSWQQIEGLKFYRFASWKKAANFLAAVNQRQEHMIHDLTVEMQDLARRVMVLERTGVARAPGTPAVDRRIEALEKKVKEMSDGGNL
jgi:hypothetical protein